MQIEGGRLKAIRFGATVEGPRAYRGLGDWAREVEQIGYSTLLVTDHLDQLAWPPILATAAAATTRLRLGTFVLNNALRNPALLAQELSTLDLLSDGRLEVGIGAGFDQHEFESMGVESDTVNRRIAKLQESVHVLKGLFGEQPFEYTGVHYRIGPMTLPRPLQRPHPPFLIGGGGRRLLSYAAQEADIVGLAPRAVSAEGVSIQGLTTEGTAKKIRWVREAAGNRIEQLEINVFCPFALEAITDSAFTEADKLRDLIYKRYAIELSRRQILESPHFFIGTVATIVAKFQELRTRFGINYFVVRGQVRDFGAVVERLAGT